MLISDRLHITKRRLLQVSLAIGALHLTNDAMAADTDDIDLTALPKLPEGIVGNGPDYNQTVRGTLRPTKAEQQIADAIAAGAPKSGTGRTVHPYEVAEYFLDIVNHPEKYDKDWPGYMRAWPRQNAPANPLIEEHFFKSTGLSPTGDITAWCSAYVNWCFLQAAAPSISLKPTRDASSSSWRSWGQAITFKKGESTPIGGTPMVGDIVVFRDVKDQTYGHVAFFRKLDGDHIQFFGGNHLEGSPVRHVISEKRLPLWGNVLEIHSIRHTAGLNS